MSMKQLEPGQTLGGFTIDARLHAGGMADLYRVHCADTARQPDFPLLLKVPRMKTDEGGENLLGFETEKQILAALHGPHVPRFVAAGDIAQPYLVMEFIPGETLQQWLDRSAPRDAAEIARIGAQIADALHALHQQDACHLDLKPANVMLRGGGGAVLLDFGLSWHARLPDLLAEEQRSAVGSHGWIAPEQIVGVRGDPRSDIFALGVILYEICTGELPFGNPQTAGGLRQRFWMQPRPPRQHDARIPAWLQEIILACIEPQAENRYASAALLAFDLVNPDQVKVTARGEATYGAGLRAQLRRWMTRTDYRPSALPTPAPPPPIVMVAVPHRDANEAVLEALRQAVKRTLGNRPGARLSCVTVVPPRASGSADDELSIHQKLLEYLRAWLAKIDLGTHVATCHVLEAGDVAHALLIYAAGNHANIMILGAATHGLQLQRFVATVPIKVAMHAPCTVMLVKA
jgi:nucleotide-binding universal stress UspA family protein